MNRPILIAAALLMTLPAVAAPESGTYKCHDGQSFAVDFGDEAAVVTLEGRRVVMLRVADQEGHWADPDSSLVLIERGDNIDIMRDFKPYLAACVLQD